MKTGIFTVAFGKANLEKAAITNQFKTSYCALHGYDYVFISSENKGRGHPRWEKPRAALKLLPCYDVLVWIDADAAPVNFSIPIDNYLKDGYDLCIGKDVLSLNHEKWYFNSGAFIMRNTSWMRSAIEEWIRRGKNVSPSRNLQDQPELNNMYYENWDNMRSHVFVLDMGKRSFQSVNGGHYKSGIFIKHCAGTNANDFKKVWWDKLEIKDYGGFEIRK